MSSDKVYSDEVTGVTLMSKGMFGVYDKLKVLRAHDQLPSMYNIQLTIYKMNGDSTSVLEVVEFPETVSYNDGQNNDRLCGSKQTQDND